MSKKKLLFSHQSMADMICQQNRYTCLRPSWYKRPVQPPSHSRDTENYTAGSSNIVTKYHNTESPVYHGVGLLKIIEYSH